MSSEENNKCDACNGDGYFGDFMPGLYPMPCQFCCGTGFTEVIPKNLVKELDDLRNRSYDQIEMVINRPKIAGKIFELTFRIALEVGQCNINFYTELLEEQNLYKKTLAGMPKDYTHIEYAAIKETWDSALNLAPIEYKDLVKKHRDRIVGKSLEDLVIMEVMDHARHDSEY